MTTTARRPTVRSVAMPAEHGGWGLTLEPGLLGLLLAPSPAGVLLVVAALSAFLLRTPLRLLLIGRRRAADRPRSTMGEARQRLAGRLAAVELLVLTLSAAGAWLLAVDPWWWLPGLIATPLFGLALWFDMRSLSRHVVPEIVGSVAIASVAAMGALAGGGTWAVAIGAWLILGARTLSSIPHVRAQVARIHGRAVRPLATLAGDVAAIIVALGAVIVEPALVPGAMAVGVLITLQRITLLRPPRPARVLGIRQMVLGFGVVGATVVGVALL